MEAVPTCVSSGVGSMAISTLVNRALAMFDELGKKSKDMETAKGKLDKAMVPVQTVLTAVDQGQIKVPEKALDDWIWHFRNAVEEAEDTIDEIDYYKLEEKVCFLLAMFLFILFCLKKTRVTREVLKEKRNHI